MDVLEKGSSVGVGSYLEYDYNNDGNFWVGCMVYRLEGDILIAKALRAERVYCKVSDAGRLWVLANKSSGVKYGALVKVKSKSNNWEAGVITSLREEKMMISPVSNTVEYKLNIRGEGMTWRFPKTPDSGITYIRRGDIWTAFVINTDEVRDYGSAHSIQIGVRPYVVTQSRRGCGSNVLMCSPVSSASRLDYPFLQRIQINKESVVHYEQGTQIPRVNFLNKIGKLTKEQLHEMEARLAIPIDLCSSSILHIQRVAVNDIKYYDGKYYYFGKLILKYSVVPFQFSQDDICDKLGLTLSELSKWTKSTLSGYLESLKGLQFLHSHLQVN